MKTALCKADRQPTRLDDEKAPLDIGRKVYTGRRHSGRRDHRDKRFNGQRPVQWVIETCEVMGSESTLQSVRIQTRCECGRRWDGSSRSPYCTPLLKTKGARVSEAMRAGDARAEGPGCRFSHRGTNATPPPLDNPRPALAGLLKEVENRQHNNPSFVSFKIIRIIVQIRRLTIFRQ